MKKLILLLFLLWPVMLQAQTIQDCSRSTHYGILSPKVESSRSLLVDSLLTVMDNYMIAQGYAPMIHQVSNMPLDIEWYVITVKLNGLDAVVANVLLCSKAMNWVGKKPEHEQIDGNNKIIVITNIETQEDLDIKLRYGPEHIFCFTGKWR